MFAHINETIRQRKPCAHLGTSIDMPDRVEPFTDVLNEMETLPTLPRLAWGLGEVSNATGLSVPFLRAEVRAGRLPVRRFGRRVLVRDEDLKTYLARGSDQTSRSKSMSPTKQTP